jgi:hypothetical protein
VAEQRKLHAMLAEFDEPSRMLEAARKLREHGFTNIDAFSPFPIEGLAEAIGFSDKRVPVIGLLGGIAGGVLGVWLTIGPTVDYPLWIGGRPLVALPAYVIITVALIIFGAAYASVAAAFLLSGLPRYHHPLFEAEDFPFFCKDIGDCRDRYFIAIFADENFDHGVAASRLAELDPLSIVEVEEKEE